MQSLAAALALARAGLPVFPCLPSKAPACRNGHKAASSDPQAVAALWRRSPGELVGVPTGAASGFDALDLDLPRHAEALDWWHEARSESPVTRTHQTRSGGLHLFFVHRPGLRCWAGRPVIGIDGRSTGGYIVWWPAAGEPVLEAGPLAEWPDWLLTAVQPPPPATRAPWNPEPILREGGDRAHRYAIAALANAAGRVAAAPAGSRNATLNGQAYGLGRLIAARALDSQTVAARLAAAAAAAGLSEREIVLTLTSALTAAGAS
jgi:hypothetical protein